MHRLLLGRSTGRAGIAARALALTALSCMLAAAALSLAARETGVEGTVFSRGMPAPKDRPIALAAPAADPDLRQQFERHALNALVVPVLDDEGNTPVWADPSLLLACGPATHIDVDHRPLTPGAAQSGRAFTLSWTLDHCAPFGADGPVLTGQVELDVFRDDDGLSAIVRPLDLQIERQGHLARLNHSFTARMP